MIQRIARDEEQGTRREQLLGVEGVEPVDGVGAVDFGREASAQRIESQSSPSPSSRVR